MITHPYARLMDEDGVSIVFNLDLSNPVEISDFVSAFAGLGGQFERHIKSEHPDLEGEVKVYVKEVRKGSIEAELMKWSQKTGQSGKVYPKPLKGYENGKAPELYRPI